MRSATCVFHMAVLGLMVGCSGVSQEMVQDMSKNMSKIHQVENMVTPNNINNLRARVAPSKSNASSWDAIRPTSTMPAPAQGSCQRDERELELMHAQTEAIKSLTKRVNFLEQRLGQIERGRR